MKSLLSAVLVVLTFTLIGCGSGDSSGLSGMSPRTNLVCYELVRDVKAGEKLEMAMLKPGTVYSTVKNDDLRNVVLTSADIKDFPGKSFKKDAKKGDFLEKGLFE